MTRKIVKARGGTLEIQNNTGCVVTIKIPTEWFSKARGNKPSLFYCVFGLF